MFLPFYAFHKLPTVEYYHKLITIVKKCDRLGYDSVWLDDHLMYQDCPTIECWTALAYIAALTKKIRLGTMVTCNAHRNPGVLAKAAATVDILSNGRVEFGIGAGVQKTEHIAYGFEFPTLSTRINQLDEAIEVIKQLWICEKASFQGKYYSLKEAVCEPKPLQKPHPPIIVGGSGEQLLKVTAKYADRFDWGFLPSIEEYTQKMEILKKNCRAIGRDFEQIEKSCWPAGQILIAQNNDELNSKIKQFKPAHMALEDFKKSTLVGTPQECIEHLRFYADLGISYFMLYFADLPSTEGLSLFAKEVIRNVS
jgi:F420-dependent oxidoreductase-like protein